MAISEQAARASGSSSSAAGAATAVVAGGDNDNPSVPHPAYSRMNGRWKKCRDLMIGTDAIHNEPSYVPQYERESQKMYDARRTIAAVYDGFKRTVLACSGMLLQKPPTLGKDMPKEMSELAENIDNAGTHLDVFTERLTTDGMTTGLGGIIVEYPRVERPEAVDADAERRLGLRPYWIMVRAEDILLPIFGRANGATRLMLLVVREVSEQLVGQFGVQSVSRYWEYRQVGATVTSRLWEEPVGGGKPEPRGKPAVLGNITSIPFAPLLTGQKIGAFETVPPLYGLAELNLEHHRMKTSRESLQELACVPTLVRVGYKPRPDPARPGELIWDPVLLGPGNVIDAPAVQGVNTPVYWLSPDVGVLEPSDRTLQDIKADMGAVGLSFVAPDKRAAETAEAKRIDSEAQNASLRMVGQAVRDCLETAFQHTAQYMGKPKLASGSVTIHTDFESTILDANMVSALGSLAERGKLSLDTLLMLLEKGGVLPDGFDREEEIRRILQEGGGPKDDSAGGGDGGGAAGGAGGGGE